VCVCSVMLQELLQNAEDAGATVVKFLYDNNTYGQDSSKLSAPRLAKYQVRLSAVALISILLVVINHRGRHHHQQRRTHTALTPASKAGT